MNAIELYTISYTPFALGGNLQRPIKTIVNEYERVAIGLGYYVLVVKNTQKKLYHAVLEDCGAVIGTDTSKMKLVKAIKQDVAGSDPEIMKEQIENGKVDCQNAKFLPPDQFFAKFSE